jgi:malate synthase
LPNSAPSHLPTGVTLTKSASVEGILTNDALAFVADLARTFSPRVHELLDARKARQKRFVSGEEKLGFLASTKSVRDADWKVASLPADLLDRRVEITGPVDRKMIINALNSGASVFMADFEDANSPTFENCVQGQKNLFDAIRRTISFTNEAGKAYALNEKVATLLVRPRGWHLVEKHVLVDGAPVPGGLFDFGLYFFHNANALLERGTGPYFYLPKMESHFEARLWNDVFVRAQEKLGIPRGTIKATVLIETLPAAFEMDEILHELREHSSGLNCGRWDYIFSFIKKRSHEAAAVLPDRSQVTMDKGFLRAYSQLLIKTCHRRGVHAMGGMAAQIPIKDDKAANDAATEKVRADKLREVKDGHDGTWVAHPALVAVAKAIFDEHMPQKNQIESKPRLDVAVTEEDLLRAPEGTRTEEGARHNVRVGIQYVEAWLRGSGAVPLYNLMEDAATAEISRAQVWQWLAHKAPLDDGKPLTKPRVLAIIEDEMKRIRGEVGDARFESGRFSQAKQIFQDLVLAPELEDFLTIPAYALLEG